MTAYTIFSDASDGRVRSSDNTYLTARSGGTFQVKTTLTSDACGQWFDDPTYRLYEAYFKFDCSVIDSGETVDSADFTLRVTNIGNATTISL